jgi:hypothetical protein
MSITKNAGRQEVISAYVDVALADLTSGAAAAAIDLPPGAVVVGGDVVVDTAFDSGTSDAIVVGDASVANRYLTSTSIAATGRTALVPTGFKVTAAQPAVAVTWTGVGTAATVGALRLRVDYIVRGRSFFTQS